MKIVIEIDEKYLKGVKELVESGDINYEPWVAIANGTPLPKGHGRLIDADDVKRSYSDREGYVFTAFHFYETVDNATTIVPEDKSESVDKDAASN